MSSTAPPGGARPSPSKRRFAGTLYPEAQFEVAPRTAGRLVHLAVDIGDAVERGQVVARFDDAEAEQQVQEARAAVAVARAAVNEAQSSLDATRRELERARQLRQQRIASAAELETAEAAMLAQQARVSLADAQVRQSEAALRAAEVRLSYTVIRADWAQGDQVRVVGERFVDEGTTVASNTPLISLLDIGTLIGAVYVTERDYPRLRSGQAARIVAEAYPERAFDGTISRIAPMFREATRQARIEVRVPNPERLLKPGMFVTAHVELGRVAQATVVPQDALVERDGRTGVFLVEPGAGTVRFVAVEPGIVEGARVEIRAPALRGVVVTLGQHLLEDGSRVVVPDRAPSTAPARAPERP